MNNDETFIAEDTWLYNGEIEAAAHIVQCDIAYDSHMKKFFIFVKSLCAVLLISSCSLLPAPKPSIAYDESLFAIPPIIIKRNENYYLRYRLKISDDYNFRKVLVAGKSNSKGYYYFIGPTSFFEYGNLVERPLVIDNFVDFAKNNSIYWLDPNGNETKIKIVEEKG